MTRYDLATLSVVLPEPVETAEEAALALVNAVLTGGLDIEVRPSEAGDDETVEVRVARPKVLDDLALLVRGWQQASEALAFEGDEYDSADDEERDALSAVYSEAASRVAFLIFPYDENVDTSSSASIQHFIDTGEYLPAATSCDAFGTGCGGTMRGGVCGTCHAVRDLPKP